MGFDSRFAKIKDIHLVAYGISAYPALLLFLFYGTWALAWLSLGHQPRPTWDDPKSINVFVSCVHLATWILIFGSYIALPLNAFFVLLEVLRRILHRQWNIVTPVTVPILLWLCLFFLMNRDPGRVGYWFFD